MHVVIAAIGLLSMLTFLVGVGCLIFNKTRKVGAIVAIVSVVVLVACWQLSSPEADAASNQSAKSKTDDMVIPSTASAWPSSRVEAIALKSTGKPVLFVDIKERVLAVGEEKIRLYCATDGTGEIVVETREGEFLAVNGAARGRIKNGFWAVRNKELIPILDTGFPNEVPARLVFLEPHIGAIIKTGVEMCPLGSPSATAAFEALKSGLNNYPTNADRLGIAIP